MNESPFIPHGWSIAARSAEVGKKPVPVEVGGVPVALFRSGSGDVGALIDRCPHRNAPLSAGRLRGDELECAYHGWRFGVDGHCTFAAGIDASAITAACHASALQVREQQGFVWVSSGPATRPETPYRFRCLDDAAYSTAVAVLETAGSLQAVAENILDVPHTAYLHGGLFRKPGVPQERRVEIRRYSDRVEAEYFDEERPGGMIGRILAPGGGTVTHVDRFLLPGMTEVEYRLGSATEFHVAVALTPLSPFRTRLFAVAGLRLPRGRSLARLLLRPLILRIFRQDALMLEKQAATIRTFGGERFVTTQADVLAPEIARLLKSARSGDGAAAGSEPVIRSMRIRF